MNLALVSKETHKIKFHSLKSGEVGPIITETSQYVPFIGNWYVISCHCLYFSILNGQCAINFIGTWSFLSIIFIITAALGHTYLICCCSDPTDPVIFLFVKKVGVSCIVCACAIGLKAFKMHS
jgi:hypothetical protein